MNYFDKDKEYEKDNFSLCDSFYNEIFGELLVDIKRVSDRKLQFKGIDVVLILKDGKKVLVDEKVRRTNYGDFLVEIMSNEETGRRGWSYHHIPDYILYVFAEQGRAYFIPHLLLSLLVRNNLESLNKCRTIKAENENYTTVSKVVLFEDLFSLFGQPYEI